MDSWGGTRPWGGRRVRRGRSVYRYVHHELMTVAEALCALAVNGIVVLIVRGVPEVDAA